MATITQIIAADSKWEGFLKLSDVGCFVLVFLYLCIPSLKNYPPKEQILRDMIESVFFGENNLFSDSGS